MPKTSFVVTCTKCGKTIEVAVEKDDLTRWRLLSRPAIQFFPYLSRDVIYLIDNGVCTACAKEN